MKNEESIYFKIGSIGIWVLIIVLVMIGCNKENKNHHLDKEDEIDVCVGTINPEEYFYDDSFDIKRYTHDVIENCRDEYIEELEENCND